MPIKPLAKYLSPDRDPPPPPAKRTTKSPRPRPSGLLENVKTIVYAGLIAIGVRSFVAEPFNIPSGSMIPTLLVGDYLFISKFSYGYSRFSLPFSPALFSGRVFGDLPRRGDVVVFKYPRDDATDYIKRVIGLPGDHVRMQAGHLYLNGRELPRDKVGPYEADDNGVALEGTEYTETLPDDRRHEILKLTDEGAANNTQDYLVPPGHVFCMGDNRDNSLDSRFLTGAGVGFVPVENLLGRARFVFFSVDARDPLWAFWDWPAEIRWRRLFTAIH